MKDTDTTREGEAFARVEYVSSDECPESFGHFVVTPFHREGPFLGINETGEEAADRKARMYNEWIDAYALKVGLRMLELAAKEIRSVWDEDEGAVIVSGGRTLEIAVRALATRIEGGEIEI